MAYPRQMMAKPPKIRTSKPKSKNFPGKISSGDGENVAKYTLDGQANVQLKQARVKSASRYIPAIIKKSTLQKTHEKCAHENCNKPYEILHHVKRFALNSHSESVHENIIPLCKIHHEFEHNGISKPLGETDKLYRKYRQVSLYQIT